jgi:hypothetical protein
MGISFGFELDWSTITTRLVTQRASVVVSSLLLNYHWEGERITESQGKRQSFRNFHPQRPGRSFFWRRAACFRFERTFAGEWRRYVRKKERYEGIKLLVLPLHKQHVIGMGKHLNCTECEGNMFGMGLIKAAGL